MTRIAGQRMRILGKPVHFLLPLMLAGAVLLAVSAQAADFKWLTISGKIRSESGSIFYTAGDMAATPGTEIVTSTPWTTGKAVFRGALLRDILKDVGASGKLLKVSAADGFTVEIPVADAEKYDVILAYKMNGEWLERGAYAPFWIIYPFDAHKELADRKFYARAIWQVTDIVVE